MRSIWWGLSYEFLSSITARVYLLTTITLFCNLSLLSVNLSSYFWLCPPLAYCEIPGRLGVRIRKNEGEKIVQCDSEGFQRGGRVSNLRLERMSTWWHSPCKPQSMQSRCVKTCTLSTPLRGHPSYSLCKSPTTFDNRLVYRDCLLLSTNILQRRVSVFQLKL